MKRSPPDDRGGGKNPAAPAKSRSRSEDIERQAEEVFELTKTSWAARDHVRRKGQFDLSESEFLTLDLLTRQQPMSVGELLRAVGVLPAQMSRILRSLESKTARPMIRCEINAKDKRKVDVFITEMGLKAHQTYRSARLAMTIAALDQLDDRDRQEFMRILGQMRTMFANSLSTK